MQRRRAASRAVARYHDELGQHAGRVRWDVLQRLTAARDQLLDTTRQHLDEVADDITPERAATVAATGFDVISLGWLTHSAPRLDVALDLRAAPGP